MMNNITYRKYFTPITFIVLVSILARVYYMLQPLIVWWDSAMYIGMGKFMFSGGTIGVWEIFRPPLLPIVLGIIWKLGLDPLIFGKILMLVASILEIWLVYLIGKKFNQTVAILSAVFMSFTPVFIAYCNSPLSDIPAILFMTLACYFVLEKKYWLTGISIALAFYTRFPTLLILVPVLIYIFFAEYLESQRKASDIQKNIFYKAGIQASKVFLSTVILIIPYLIINYIQYHNPLLPVILAQKVASDPVNAHGRNIFYYPYYLLIQNPFLLFWPLIFFSFCNKNLEHEKNIARKKITVLIVLSLIIIGGYFDVNTHLEIRYTIAFLPFLALASAYGIDLIIQKIMLRRIYFSQELLITCMVLILITICTFGFKLFGPTYSVNPDLYAYTHFFDDKKGATVITTSPEVMANSDIHIVQATDTWENALDAYTRLGNQAQYIAVNNCSLICEKDADSCNQTKKAVTAYLDSLQKVFTGASYVCDLSIYKH